MVGGFKLPIFDYKCPKCSKEKKDVFMKSWESIQFCIDCEIAMEKIPSLFMVDLFPKGGIFLEHVSSEGKTFYSKGEMRKYAKEHDLELGAL